MSKTNNKPTKRLMPADNTPNASLLKPWYPALNAANPDDNGNLEGVIPPADMEHIFAHIDGINTILNKYLPNIPQSEYKGKTGITIRNTQYIIDAIAYMQKHPDTKPSYINFEDWITDLTNYQNLLIEYREVEALDTLSYRAYRIFAVSAWNKFKQYYQYVEMLAKNGNTDAAAIYENLKEYYSWTKGNRKPATDVADDLNMDINTMKQLIGDNTKRIDNLLAAEKQMQNTLNKGIKTQEEILEQNKK